MKKTLLSILAIGMIISFTLNSCSKADDIVTAAIPVPTKTDYLVGKWKMTALKADSGIISIDLYGLMPACDKDDILEFTLLKAFIEDEGPTKCDPSSPQTSTGTWTFNSTETQITTVGGDAETMTLNIVSLNATTFVGTTTDSDLPGYTLTATLTKQ